MFSLISKLALEWFEKISQLIIGLFAIIPQVIYFLYASCASLLDILQYLIRKLAGLDVYYIDGEAQSGDIVLSFIRGILGIDKSDSYSALTTVFWSLVVFGVILLILSTIFAIIKAHYNYDAKKSHPFTIIGQSLKHLALMAIVPIAAVFGLAISEVLLRTLDTITSYSEAGQDLFTITETQTNEKGEKVTIVVSTLDDSFQSGTYNERKVYASYDYFTAVNYTNQTTFSGTLFRTASYNCNRVRNGTYTAPNGESWDRWTNFRAFYSNADGDSRTEIVASQIDYAFANALRLKESKQSSAGIYQAARDGDWDYLYMDGDSHGIFGTINSSKKTKEDRILLTSYMYGYGALTSVGLINVKCFSKFNVGLVWYYYNLWGFNYFIAFAGVIAFVLILGNVVFGLIVRLIQLLALFFVFPPLVGIAPLDEGNAFKNWRKQFISDTLMAYGAIVAMNLFFLILPFLNTISFFGGTGSVMSKNGGLEILDRLMNILIMLAGLTMVKNLIKLISGFIGASDAYSTGDETRKAVGELGGKAFAATAKAGSVGIKVGAGAAKFYGNIAKGVGMGASRVGHKISNSKFAKYISQEERDKRSDERNARRQGYHQGTKRSDYYRDNIKAGMSSEEAMARANEQVERDMSALNMKRYEKRADRAAFGAGVVKFGKGVGKGAVKLAKGIGFGLAVPFGKVETDDKGNVDVGKSLKATGNMILDISKAGIKLAGGDLLRINAVGKKANEAGYLDPAKTFIKDVMGKKAVPGKFGKGLTTKKEKEDRELEAAQAQQAAQSEAMENSKQARAELEKIRKLLGG